MIDAKLCMPHLSIQSASLQLLSSLNLPLTSQRRLPSSPWPPHPRPLPPQLCATPKKKVFLQGSNWPNPQFILPDLVTNPSRHPYHLSPGPGTCRLRKSLVLGARHRRLPPRYPLVRRHPYPRICAHAAHFPPYVRPFVGPARDFIINAVGARSLARVRRLCAVLLDLLHLARRARPLPRGPVRPPPVSRAWLWEAASGGAGARDVENWGKEVGLERAEVESTQH